MSYKESVMEDIISEYDDYDPPKLYLSPMSRLMLLPFEMILEFEFASWLYRESTI